MLIQTRWVELMSMQTNAESNKCSVELSNKKFEQKSNNSRTKVEDQPEDGDAKSVKLVGQIVVRPSQSPDLEKVSFKQWR